MATTRLSTAKCSFCNERLSEKLTTKEVTMQYPNGYHAECFRMFKRQTRTLSGLMAATLQKTRERSAQQGWEYDLDGGGYDDSDGIEFLIDLYRRQLGRCAITGLEFLPHTDPDWSFHRTPSLDRRDSNGGYTRNNVQWVAQAVNKMKSTMSDDQLRELCAAVVENAARKPRVISSRRPNTTIPAARRRLRA